MRHQFSLCSILLLAWICIDSAADADAPMVYCVGTESGGSGPRSYAYEVDSASFPMIEFRAGTNDLNLENYANLLVPEGWMFAVENVPMAHFHDVKTPHGEISPGPCRCLTIGSIRWWTEDLRYTVEYFTFGFDHPSPSEDVGWDLTTRREGPPPESFTFEGDWDSPVGTGYGPLHGPAAVTIFRGDFDGDYDVDGADFLAWQRGEVSNPPSAEDLALWQTQFGTTSPSTATTVLEPTTLLLAMLGMAGACCWRRNR